MEKENIFILSSGDVLELDKNRAGITGRVPVGAILVDGLGVGDVGNVVLRDRQHLAEADFSLPGMGLEEKITVSPAPMVILRCMPLAMRLRAEEHKNTRIFVATFASNVDRVQQIINTAYKFGRKVCVDGRSMVSIIETARNLGCISIPDNTLIEIEQMKDCSEGVKPGRSALVESHISARTPFLPSSAKRCRSMASPK